MHYYFQVLSSNGFKPYLGVWLEKVRENMLAFHDMALKLIEVDSSPLLACCANCGAVASEHIRRNLGPVQEFHLKSKLITKVSFSMRIHLQRQISWLDLTKTQKSLRLFEMA